ncbi:helix-turn-helix domain-containing protein [Pseudoxanthomonas japonensis]|uniref:helix-turn-helix domain-containing protein n=1 Tax=Pseudoxanthomonas japonensis TaxID=69284 RepID=UPI00286AF9B3|nr:helix-turn-helix transcriptional regulator [Pseudoxanthomonas japonensis]
MIGRALRLTREFHRMKQVDLAKKIGISTSYLSEIEKDKKPASLELLESYSQVFGVPASTFLLFKEKRMGSDGDSGKVNEQARRLLQFFEWVTSDEDESNGSCPSKEEPKEATA